MESDNFPEKKYEDTMKSFISYQDVRKGNNDRKLSLRKRKKKLKLGLNMRSKLNLLNEHNIRIHLNQLKTNNDNIRNFFIDLNRPEYTMNNLKYLLDSKNDDEVKFGIYAVRTFFQKILKEIKEDVPVPDQNQNHLHNNINNNNYFDEHKIPLSKIDNNKIANSNYNYNNILKLFLDNNIISLLFEIIKRCQISNQNRDQVNIFECLWILLNMNATPNEMENTQLKFYSYFTQQDNLMALISLIDSEKYPQEIININLSLLSNLFIGNESFKNNVIQSPLTSYLYNYIQNQEDLNSDVIVKIFKLLFELYIDCDVELKVDAYLILFQIFYLPLILFKDEEIIKCCLEMLVMLSGKDIPELIQCFNDRDLLSTLNNIIFSRPINDENELIINSILDIFYNIISKCDKVESDIIKTEMMTKFYNNLLAKYNNEKATLFDKVEQNILLSLNNLIYFNHDNNVKYILGEGSEILNYFMKSSKSLYNKTRLLAIRSFVNILFELKIDINWEILLELTDSIIQTLINDYDDCFYPCIQCLYLIIGRSKKQGFSNDLKNFLLINGTSDLIEKVKTKLLNDSKDGKIKKYDEENFDNFIEKVNSFLSED